MLAATVGLFIASKELWDETLASLEDLPVRVVLEHTDPDDRLEFLNRIELHAPDLVLLDVDGLGSDAVEIIRQVLATRAQPRVIVMSTVPEPELILTMMRTGAREFLYPPLKDKLRAAIGRQSEDREREQPRQEARTFGFLSVKGGCGATSIVCQAAMELRRRTKKDTLLLEMDFSAGIIRSLMRVKSQYSILDAISNLPRLDRSYWRALVGEVNGGPEILAAPEALGIKESPGAQEIRQALQFMRTQYEYVLLDLGRGLNPVNLAALDQVDETFLITTLEVPALRQARKLLGALSARGYNASRIRLVINRMPKRPDVTPSELESMLGTPIYAHIPNDYHALYEAYIAGQLVAPDSQVGKATAALTCRMAGLEPAGQKRRFALFG